MIAPLIAAIDACPDLITLGNWWRDNQPAINALNGHDLGTVMVAKDRRKDELDSWVDLWYLGEHPWQKPGYWPKT